MDRFFNTWFAAIMCLLMLPLFALCTVANTNLWMEPGKYIRAANGEGTWNNPQATQELINAVAAAGFNTVRIPVSWDSHANQATYEIDPAWLARVKEVVDYCYAANMHVLINCHWDDGWLEEQHYGNTVDPIINAKQDAYWTQIAGTFVNYDDHLLFAGCNESIADTAAEMSTLLVYEQTFVDAVRAAGG